MHDRRTKYALAAVVWFAGSASQAFGSPLAEKVTAARAEVEALSVRLSNQRREANDRLSALRSERAELKRQVRLERIRQNTLDQLRDERTKRIDDQEGRILTLLNPVKRSIASAKKYVATTLPFKQEERLRRLKKIESDLAVTHPDPGRALTRLWRFIEEEEAMAREIGLGQQAIKLEGKRLLVDVARIGMALMYFRLPSGDVGWVRPVEAGWRFERLRHQAARETVLKIFDDLENNRRLGPKRLLITPTLPPASNRSLR